MTFLIDGISNNLGISYFQSGQFDPAIGEYNPALRLNPQNVKARNNLTNCMRKTTALLYQTYPDKNNKNNVQIEQ